MQANESPAACDAEAARLLPWHLTGRLSAEDDARVLEHLSQCATCRADLDDQRALRARLREDGPLEYAPQAGLAATLARIDELEREIPPATTRIASPSRPATHGTPGRRRATPALRWLAAAAIVQAVGLAFLGSQLLSRPREAAVGGYQTLSTPAPAVAGARVRAVFAPGMTLGQLGQLLGRQGLQVLSGPTEAGVYTLGFAAAAQGAAAPSLDGALQALRADPQVRFAEPASSSGAAP